ncbi:hypothetical protein HMPREF9552_01369, partial [Escherichia coli MS 198-1]
TETVQVLGFSSSRRIRQSCTMPDATLSRLIRPTKANHHALVMS